MEISGFKSDRSLLHARQTADGWPIFLQPRLGTVAALRPRVLLCASAGRRSNSAADCCRIAVQDRPSCFEAAPQLHLFEFKHMFSMQKSCLTVKLKRRSGKSALAPREGRCGRPGLRASAGRASGPLQRPMLGPAKRRQNTGAQARAPGSPTRPPTTRPAPSSDPASKVDARPCRQHPRHLVRSSGHGPCAAVL